MIQKFGLYQSVWIFNNGNIQNEKIIDVKIVNKKVFYDFKFIKQVPQSEAFSTYLKCSQNALNGATEQFRLFEELTIVCAYENEICNICKAAGYDCFGELNIRAEREYINLDFYLEKGAIALFDVIVCEFLENYFKNTQNPKISENRNLFLYLVDKYSDNNSISDAFSNDMLFFLAEIKALPIEQQGSLNETDYTKWYEWFEAKILSRIESNT